jgi:serine/threonine protein kinase/WD40 repeat protein/Tfp pilus assembly protein PilF
MSSPDAEPVSVESLLEAYLERCRRGERPSVSEYIRHYPALAEQIRELFPALALIEEFGSVSSPPPDPLPPPPTEGGGPVLRQLGEYRLLREVGRGGMGVVYEAVQETLGRHVALKVLPFQALADPVHRERFRREAQAAARLHHSNIVPVFGVGEDQGIHYYAMQFIQGQGLDAVLRELRRLRNQADVPTATVPGPRVERTDSILQGLLTGRLPGPAGSAASATQVRPAPQPLAADPPAPSRPSLAGVTGASQSDLATQAKGPYCRSAAEIGVQVADALAYAHKQGIVHRDIKPSNLLLDTRGTVWVTDFGLAKAEGSEELTGTGDIVGTLRYMAPERFQGRADPRSDVYSLGATLYELVTLCPAVTDGDPGLMMDRIRREEPPRPRRLDRAIPRDLETIILKALAKEPADRYPSADALAEDLRRFLADRPIRARRTRLPERLWRWCRRNPVVAGLSGAVTVLVAVLCAGWAVATLLRQERDVAVANLVRAERAEADALQQSRRAQSAEREVKIRALLAQARAERGSGQAGQRVKSLQALAEAARLNPPEPLRLELRNEAIACLALADLTIGRRWDESSFGTALRVFDGSLERYARGDAQGAVSIRRVADDEELVRLPGPGTQADPLRFSPNGRFLAVRYQFEDVPFRVWDVTRGVEILQMAAPHRLAFDFSPDSRTVALGRDDNSLAVHDLPTGQRVRQWANPFPPHLLAFPPDGSRLAVAGERRVRIVEVASGKTLREWDHGSPVSALAWHPYDRNRLATAGSGVFFWDVRTGRHWTIGFSRTLEATGIAFSHGGDLLAVKSSDGTLRLWEPWNGRELVKSPGAAPQSPLQFSPDDRRLAFVRDQTGSALLEVEAGREYRALSGLTGVAWGVYESGDISPDGRLLTVAAANGSIRGLRLWDLATGRFRASLAIGQTFGVAFPPAGNALISSGDAGLYHWPVRTEPKAPGGLRLGPPRKLGVPGPLHQVGVSQDGRHLAVVRFLQDQAVVVDRTKPVPLPPLPSPFGWDWLPSLAAWFHPLAPTVPLHHSNVMRLALSPDGRWVATGTWHGTGVKVWEAATGKLVKDLPVPKSAQVVFSPPEGRWLVTSTGEEFQLYEVGSWRLVRRVARDAGADAPGACAFTADGKVLALAISPTVVQLTDPATGQVFAALEAPDQLPPSWLRFGPDGSQLVVCAGRVCALHVWDLRRIRARLAEMDLDWELPPYPPVAAPPDPGPLRVQVDLGELRPRTSGAADQLRAELDKYSQAIAQNPEDADAYHRRGHVHERLGQYHQAIDDYGKAIVRQPGSVHLYVDRAWNYRYLMDYEKAVLDLKKALELNPERADACYLLARLYVLGPVALRAPDLALPLAQRAVALSTDNRADRLLVLAMAHYRRNQFQQAAAALEQVLADNKGKETAAQLYVLALSNQRLGERAKARASYERAVGLHAQSKYAPYLAEELNALRAEAEALLTQR